MWPAYNPLYSTCELEGAHRSIATGYTFGVDAEETALAAGADDEDLLLPRPILGRAPSVAASSAASLECFLSASPATDGDRAPLSPPHGDMGIRGVRFRHGQS